MKYQEEFGSNILPFIVGYVSTTSAVTSCSVDRPLARQRRPSMVLKRKPFNQTGANPQK
jgi:hypothetical protein